MASAAVENVFDNVAIAGTAYCDGASGGCSMPMQSLSELYHDNSISRLWVFSTKPWVTMPSTAPRTQSAACKRKSELAKQPHLPKILGLLNWWLPKAIKTRYERAWPAFCAYDQLQTQSCLRVGMGKELKHGVCIFSRKKGVSLLAATWNDQQKLFQKTEFAKPPFVVLIAPAQHLFAYGDITFMNCSHTDLNALTTAAEDMRVKLDAATRFVSAFG